MVEFREGFREFMARVGDARHDSAEAFRNILPEIAQYLRQDLSDVERALIRWKRADGYRFHIENPDDPSEYKSVMEELLEASDALAMEIGSRKRTDEERLAFGLIEAEMELTLRYAPGNRVEADSTVYTNADREGFSERSLENFANNDNPDAISAYLRASHTGSAQKAHSKDIHMLNSVINDNGSAYMGYGKLKERSVAEGFDLELLIQKATLNNRWDCTVSQAGVASANAYALLAEENSGLADQYRQVALGIIDDAYALVQQIEDKDGKDKSNSVLTREVTDFYSAFIGARVGQLDDDFKGRVERVLTIAEAEYNVAQEDRKSGSWRFRNHEDLRIEADVFTTAALAVIPDQRDRLNDYRTKVFGLEALPRPEAPEIEA